MKLMYKTMAALSLMASFGAAHANLNVFACEPEWASLTQELAGDKAEVFSATQGLQDVHHIEARPSLVPRLRRADLLVCTGAQLEIGWLPVIERQANNDKIRPGLPGYFEATHYVRMLEVPAAVDRAEGDVHPAGNPHIQTDPRNISLVAQALSKRLIQIDPANTAFYQARYAAFKTRWQAAVLRWEREALPLKGQPVVVDSKAFTYLVHWLGLNVEAELEPKPGIEPTAAHLEEVLQVVKQQPIKMVIQAAFLDNRPSDWMAQHANASHVVLPFTIGGTPKATDLFGLFDDTINRLLAGLKKGG